MAPYLIIALIGLLHVPFFGQLSYFRREGVSTRFIAESLAGAHPGRVGELAGAAEGLRAGFPYAGLLPQERRARAGQD